MNSRSLHSFAKMVRKTIDVWCPPKYHICEGCLVRTETPKHRMDCPVKFDPFDNNCVKHDRFMKLERGRFGYDK